MRTKMVAQFQYRQDLEDRLWAIQIMKQARIDILEDTDQSAAYHHGLEVTLQKVYELFAHNSPSKVIWIHNDIRSLLLTVRALFYQEPTWPETEVSHRGFYQGCEGALWAVATCFGVSLLPTPVRSEHLPKRAEVTPWFLAEDVKIILRAMHQTLVAISPDRDNKRPGEYDEGFEAALRYIADHFGIDNLSSSRPFQLRPVTPRWFHKDVENQLLRIYQSTLTTGCQDNSSSPAYQRGFRTAIRCVVYSFDIKKLSKRIEEKCAINPHRP